jgi:hypothetical protein
MPVILATSEAEIGRIAVPGLLRQKNKNTKNKTTTTKYLMRPCLCCVQIIPATARSIK